MDVILSTNRCVAVSVNLADMSRPTEMMCEPLVLNTVSSTQSLWDPCCNINWPLAASNARTVLSEQPKATNFPSGDQLTP